VTDAPDIDPTPSCCCCGLEATLRTRVIPRRDVPVLSDEMRRATAWPDSANPCDLFTCVGAACRDRVKAAARSILGAETLGDAVVNVALVDKAP
jgi:hypothetical protein